MPQTIQIDPAQVPAAIAQFKGEKSAIEEVISIKANIMSLLEQMEADIAAGNLSAALSNFVQIQRIEYSLTIRSLNQKLAQTNSNLAQLEAVVVPAHSLPHKGFRAPRA